MVLVYFSKEKYSGCTVVHFDWIRISKCGVHDIAMVHDVVLIKLEQKSSLSYIVLS